ncbi:MAG TPA: cyclic nucleotide-binding domain-containing protein [Planctomycetes bacterium]|nr:cyclic nucleotide-binding domain-containing protein [Planctomycetota bacterium]HIN80995.1 cyclic nucleotide-binding domain-containing protein [Planctomycetota bacterium]
MPTEYVESFQRVPLFDGLSPSEIADLLRISEDVETKKGDTIVLQGSPGDGFYVIGAGSFEVLKSGNRNEVLARLEDNAYFGEMSLVSEDVRSATVMCIEDGRLKKFAKEPFNQLLDEGDLTAFKVVRNMARILAQRLAASDERLVS